MVPNQKLASASTFGIFQFRSKGIFVGYSQILNNKGAASRDGAHYCSTRIYTIYINLRPKTANNMPLKNRVWGGASKAADIRDGVGTL